MSRRWPLRLPLLLVGLLVPLLSVESSNIDFNNVITFSDPKHEQVQFGASVVLHKHAGIASALFGAPQATDENGLVTGGVYRCGLHDSKCDIVLRGNAAWVNLAGRRIEMKAENMSFGMAMAYDFRNEHVLVCAPRRTLSWLNGPDPKKDLHYFTVGSCYVYQDNLKPFSTLQAEADLQKTEDLNDQDKSKVLHHINSMRELGFSIAVKNGKYVIGAPGYQDWSGKSMSFEGAQEPYPISTTPVEMRDSADYAGYSVEHITIGKTDYIVHGAPRRNNVKGEVIIARPGATHNWKSNIHISGTQTGEYFGAAVAVADVNGDGLDDLLVGAPFNSPTEEVRDVFGSVTNKLSKGTYDRGAVYVFLGKENDIDRYPKLLYPEDKSDGGRFGSVITNLGDLDKDGCDDIAVGAPFEKRISPHISGAVYIFRGSAKHGVSNENRERVGPPSTAYGIRGFGYSISKGLDVTGNNYLDFAVGAVLSGHGFVYRSRPVIMLNVTIKGTDKPVPREGGNCHINDRSDLFCFNLTICVTFKNPESEKPAQFDGVFLRLDINADAKSSTPRALVANSTRRAGITSTSLMPLTTPGKEECIDIRAFVLPAPQDQDMLNSIEFRLNYDIDDSGVDRNKFCATCPVLYSKKPVSAVTGYKVNCKHEGCVVHLNLRAYIEGLDDKAQLAIGRTEPLNLKIDVDSASSSDIAFRTEVVVTLKRGFNFNNPDKCTRIDGAKEAIACLIENELHGGQSRSLSLKLQLDPDLKLDEQGSLVEFVVHLRTASKDQNAAVNRKQFAYPLQIRADVGISGTGLLENVIFKKNASAVTMDHIYTVTKYHESPIDAVDLTVSVPVSLSGDDRHQFPFVKVFSAEARATDTSIKFDCVSQTPSRSRRESPPAIQSAFLQMPKDRIRQLTVDCANFNCRLYKCRIGPFLPGTRATFHLQMLLNISHLIDLVNAIPEHIVFRSEASIAVHKRLPANPGPNPRPKSATIQTVLVREGKPLGRGIDWWWLVLAVVVGLVMVTIMFYVLYKCGFFKRSSRDDLSELQKDTQSASPILATHHSPINNMVDVDDNDNSATFHDSKV